MLQTPISTQNYSGITISVTRIQVRLRWEHITNSKCYTNYSEIIIIVTRIQVRLRWKRCQLQVLLLLSQSMTDEEREVGFMETSHNPNTWEVEAVE